jgi:hypothetical protein
MPKRKWKLDGLSKFQQRLEDYFKAHVAQQTQTSQELEEYKKLVYDYHKKGFSVRNIGIAVNIPASTVHYWIKEMEKKEQPQPQPQPQAEARPNA